MAHLDVLHTGFAESMIASFGLASSSRSCRPVAPDRRTSKSIRYAGPATPGPECGTGSTRTSTLTHEADTLESAVHSVSQPFRPLDKMGPTFISSSTLPVLPPADSPPNPITPSLPGSGAGVNLRFRTFFRPGGTSRSAATVGCQSSLEELEYAYCRTVP